MWIINKTKYIPVMWCPITFEFEIVGGATDAIVTPSGASGKYNTKNSFQNMWENTDKSNLRKSLSIKTPPWSQGQADRETRWGLRPPQPQRSRTSGKGPKAGRTPSPGWWVWRQKPERWQCRLDWLACTRLRWTEIRKTTVIRQTADTNHMRKYIELNKVGKNKKQKQK